MSRISAVGALGLAIAVSLSCGGSALGQEAAAQQQSVGKGWPVTHDPNGYEQVGAMGGRGIFRYTQKYGELNPTFEIVSAKNGEVPEGVEPLERDLFTSDDFYADRDLWTDPRYFRCSSLLSLEHIWGGLSDRYVLIGDKPPETAAWGHCDRDYPRESIVSPYGFGTAQEHYEALRAEAEEQGALTSYTRENLPVWDGYYNTRFLENWYWMRINQVPTILSLLTPQYQQRVVQEAYHNAHNNAQQWPGTYCWPEGYMRRHALYTGDSNSQIIVTPDMVQFAHAGIDNLIYQVHIGREFNMEGAVPRLGDEVPRWMGESIGFWAGDELVMWTSNVQGWTNHGTFEFSNALQSIEIWSPEYGEDGAVTALAHEVIYYDPEAFVEPIRMLRVMDRTGLIADAKPFVVSQCLQSQYPVDGRMSLVPAGQTVEYTVPDYYNRPWAQIWERNWEEGMDRPDPTEGLFGF